MSTIIHLGEPALRFGYDQTAEHPKDGLTLFGPYAQVPGSVRYGVIGTSKGLAFFDNWASAINKALPAYEGSRFRRKKNAVFGKLAHQLYPGFESVFGITWAPRAEIRCVVPDNELSEALLVHELHTRIARVVKLYTSRLIQQTYQSESGPDIWFVIVSRELEGACSPSSTPPSGYLQGTRAEDAAQRGLFLDQANSDAFAEEYQEALTLKPDFHNQLKARLLKHQVITQIMQEETLDACLRTPDNPVRDKEDPATIAWNLTTSIFYKTRRRPWILAEARAGVCYMGIVFKRLAKAQGNKNACCGAQMFLEDGTGMVFKGALGPWYSEHAGECHIDQGEAKRLLATALKSYADAHSGQPPREMFVHGSARFDEHEWAGFSEAAAEVNTSVVGIRIRRVSGGLKLFTNSTGAVMRGTALLLSKSKAFLFTNGFVPRLNTYPGWDVPNPLDVEICNGEAEMKVVLQDILRLSKLNYNSCKFSDGNPITLKFAGSIGDILTTMPPDHDKEHEGEVVEDYKPLPFWHYI